MTRVWRKTWPLVTQLRATAQTSLQFSTHLFQGGFSKDFHSLGLLRQKAEKDALPCPPGENSITPSRCPLGTGRTSTAHPQCCTKVTEAAAFPPLKLSPADLQTITQLKDQTEPVAHRNWKQAFDPISWERIPMDFNRRNTFPQIQGWETQNTLQRVSCHPAAIEVSRFMEDEDCSFRWHV